MTQLSYGSRFPRQQCPYGRAGFKPGKSWPRRNKQRATMYDVQKWPNISEQSFRRCPEILCGYCVCLLLSPSQGTDDSVVQTTDGVCSSNLLAPFQTSQYPNGGVLRDEYGSSRLSPDPTHFWRWKRDRSTSLHTEPTRNPPVETHHK